jgi:hypothetical protein
MTVSASSVVIGTSQRKINVVAIAPKNCATIKPGTSTNLIPAKLSLIERASVTAGFANDVDEVNQ